MKRKLRTFFISKFLIFIAVFSAATNFVHCSAYLAVEKTNYAYLVANPRISVAKFDVYPKGENAESSDEKFQRWQKLKKAFNYCIETKSDLYFPKGIYDVGERNFPFREDDLTTDVLKDCNGITIFGEGRGTVLMTSSTRGADVLQLNMLKNLTIKDFDITAILTSEKESGSNGVSITNGFDNIYLDNLFIYDLPGIDREGYIDGGKGVTMQFSPKKNSIKGTLQMTDVTVENCAYGFRFDAAHVSDLLKGKINISIKDFTVNKAYQGFSIDFGEAAEKIKNNAEMNVNVSASLNNCQQFVRFSRVIGGSYDFKVNKTESRPEILKDKGGTVWKKDDFKLFGFLSNYSKEITMNISGNVGEVDEKIWIGAVGSIVEPYNLKNRTENNHFTFDLAGTSREMDIKIINYKGESIHNSTINISTKTVDKYKIPTEFKSNNNTLNVK